jgi:hypothetical protein
MLHNGTKEGSMKESDILLRRAEKLRRDSRCVRKEATRLSLASDQQRMMDVANSLEAAARDLEGRARRRAGQLEESALRHVLREGITASANADFSFLRSMDRSVRS